MQNVLPEKSTIESAIVFDEAMIIKKLFALFNAINPSMLPISLNEKTIEGAVTMGTSNKKTKQNIGYVYGQFIINAEDIPDYIFSTKKTFNMINATVSTALKSVKKKQFLSLYELKNEPKLYCNLNSIMSNIGLNIGQNLETVNNLPKFSNDDTPDARMPITAFNDFCGQASSYVSGFLKIQVYKHGIKFTAIAYGENRNSDKVCGDISGELKHTIYININSIFIFHNTINVIAPSGSVVKFYSSKDPSTDGYFKISFRIGGIGVCKIYIEGISYKD